MTALEQSAEAKRREAAIEFARNQVVMSTATTITNSSAIPLTSPERKSPLMSTARSGVFSSGGGGGGGGGGNLILDKEEEQRNRLLNVGTTFGTASQQDNLVRLFRQLLFKEEVRF